jgi:hypothetical protein
MPRIDYCERVTDELYDKHISGEQPLGICFINESSMSKGRVGAPFAGTGPKLGGDAPT